MSWKEHGHTVYANNVHLTLEEESVSRYGGKPFLQKPFSHEVLNTEPTGMLVIDNGKVKITPYKYSEDKTLAELDKYLKSTYGEHYNSADNLQSFDVWEALDTDPSSTHRNTALKYLWRYGKKNGYNRNDLLKAMHYVILLMHYNSKFHSKKVENGSTQDE